MAIPFASAYAPINDLNASIQARDARGQQAYLQRRALDNQQVAEAINAVVRQKQIESESGDRRQHYDLQRQQLANDMAARNALMTQQGSQFDRQFGLNEAIAKHQIANPRLDPSVIPSIINRDDANAEAGGIASGVNFEIKTAKAKRDAALKEINETRKSVSPGDIWTDLWTSNANWAKQARAIHGAYREEIAKISQAGQGRVIIRNVGEDDFEAVPIVLPPLNFPGMRPTPVVPQQSPQLPDAGVFPAGWGPPPISSVAPVVPPVAARPAPFNPFAAYSAMRQQQAQSARTNAPSVVAIPPPAQLPRVWNRGPGGKLIPVQ